MKRDQIFKEILNNPIYDSILEKYLSNKNERNEFRQFLWVMLCEIPTEKIEAIWAKNEFLWYYCGIVRNQIASSTSKWHKEYRITNQNISQFKGEIEDEVEDILDQELNRANKLKEIDEAINHHLVINPHYKTDFDLFRLKFDKGMTYRAIAKKTKIPLTSVYEYILNAKTLIQTNIRFKKEKIR